ncbi:TPA: hypothetical protein JAV82_005255 [Kluyvera ascorbata]|nr:hypothetical protein [Kluyvera ascorbata]
MSMKPTYEQLEAQVLELSVKLANVESRCAEVVAENAGLKSKGREVLNEACKVYEKLNATISPDSGDFMDGQTLHEFQFLLDAETPATDAAIANIQAMGVDAAIEKLIQKFQGTGHIGVPVMVLESFAAQLRQGAKS